MVASDNWERNDDAASPVTASKPMLIVSTISKTIPIFGRSLFRMHLNSDYRCPVTHLHDWMLPAPDRDAAVLTRINL